MKIYLAADHRGQHLLPEITHLLEKNPEFKVILSTIPKSPEDDYVDFALDICQRMDKEHDIGVLICRTGIGMSIAANKVKGILCARVVTEEEAYLSRTDDGANVIALDLDTVENMINLIKIFIATPKTNAPRHERRVGKILKYENGEYNVL